MSPRLLFIHALSPIHAGTGQAVGGIDLPIAREKPTNVPLVPGSSIKGVLRARPAGDLHTAVFGPDTANASEHAGGVQISDANLIFLPVRSLRGTFAWVTSPYLLRRLLRDARECGIDLGAAPADPAEGVALVTGDRLAAGEKVVFEDLDFTRRKDEVIAGLAARVAALALEEADRAFFVERACVVHDDVMGLLLQTCTEITTRIKLDPDRKTVDESGALWTEEALPVESLLGGLVVATPVKPRKGPAPEAGAMLDYLRDLAEAGAVQLGGKATVGRGICRLRICQGGG